MARDVFLVTSSLRGFGLVEDAGLPLLTRHRELGDTVRAVAPACADLFASPLLAKSEDGQPTDASWYASRDLPVRRLSQLSGNQQHALLGHLQSCLDAVPTDDGEASRQIRAMFSISGPEAILAVGDRPVLVDWGVVPSDLSPDLETAAAHAASVFGRLGLSVSWAPLEEEGEGTADVAAGAAAAAGVSAAAAADLFTEPENDESRANGTRAGFTAGAVGESAVDGDGGSALRGAGTAAAIAGVEGGAAGSDAMADGSPPPVAPAATLVEEPWYRRSWVGWLLAALLVLLFLLLLWWLLWAPGGLLVRPVSDRAIQTAILDGLRQERDRMVGLKEGGCTPELQAFVEGGYYTAPVQPARPPVVAVGPEVVTPGRGGTIEAPGGEAICTTCDVRSGDGTALRAPGGEAAPRAPGGEAAPRTSGGEAPPEAPGSDAATQPGTPGTEEAVPLMPASGMSALAAALESSVALVFGPERDGSISMGSGFFISPSLLVTNRHVVAEMDPSSVLVTSEQMGTPVLAKVRAMTANDDIGEPDFALLELTQPVASAVPLQITASAPKLARVVAAGYPAFIADTDPQFQALMDGDAGASPGMIFTSGEVSVVQDRFNGPSIIIHTADMSQGSSGGPLVDVCGRVIGVNTFISEDASSGRRGLYSLAGAALQQFLSSHAVDFQKADGGCGEEGGLRP